MSNSMPATRPTRTSRQPRIILNEDDLAHIEGLADGAYERNPVLADRLLDEVSRARIVPSKRMPKNVIGIGSTATYRDETSGQDRTVTLVYPQDADIAKGRISLMTPVGVALLGLSEGAVFHWDTRGDQRRMLTVIKVVQGSEASKA